MRSISYYFGKLLQKIQVPTLRDCDIDPTAKICQRSNLINVSMGRYSYMGAANSMNNVKIGNFCSIASYCAIGGGAHPTSFVPSSPVFLDGNNVFGKNFAHLTFEESKPVVVGNDVWIGEGCFIAGGVSIGDGAIIGAHSVVTKDVKPFAIVAGAPARLLRYRFADDVIDGLMRSRWWDWPEEKLSEVSALFDKPDSFLEALSARETQE